MAPERLRDGRGIATGEVGRPTGSWNGHHVFVGDPLLKPIFAFLTTGQTARGAKIQGIRHKMLRAIQTHDDARVEEISVLQRDSSHVDGTEDRHEDQFGKTPEIPPKLSPGSSPRTRRRLGAFSTACMVLIAITWYFRSDVVSVVLPQSPSRTTVASKPAGRVPSVGTASARRCDMTSYLTGLGTITAFKTVTVRSRVDGELVRIAFSEGQRVQEGDLLAEIDSRGWQAECHKAEGQLAKDQATFAGANLTLVRYQQLLESRIVTGQQVDDQISLVKQAEAAIQTDQATVANARLQLQFCRITAPISGRIGLRLVDSGNIIQANDPRGIAVITQLQPIALVFTIPQDNIVRLQQRIARDETIVVEAFDREFKTKLATGMLRALDNQVDPTTGTLRLKAVFENEDETLFPNQFVNVRLIVETLRDITAVPTSAVQYGENRNFVYVVQSDETVARREIVCGLTDGIDTVVSEGLNPGEMVVTEGVDKLQHGSKVAMKAKHEQTVKDQLNIVDSKEPR